MYATPIYFHDVKSAHTKISNMLHPRVLILQPNSISLKARQLDDSFLHLLVVLVTALLSLQCLVKEHESKVRYSALFLQVPKSENLSCSWPYAFQMRWKTRRGSGMRILSSWRHRRRSATIWYILIISHGFSSMNLGRTVLVIKALKQHKPNLVSNPQQQESTLSANNGDLPESTCIKRTQLQSVVTNLRSWKLT